MESKLEEGEQKVLVIGRQYFTDVSSSEKFTVDSAETGLVDGVQKRWRIATNNPYLKQLLVINDVPFVTMNGYYKISFVGGNYFITRLKLGQVPT